MPIDYQSQQFKDALDNNPAFIQALEDAEWNKSLAEIMRRQESADIGGTYQTMFGRDVGQPGLDFYGGQDLNQGELEDILMASEEREFFNDLNNPAVDRAFNDYLSRDAGQEGEEFYKDYTYDQIVAALKGEEFDEKWAGDPMSEYEAYRSGDAPRDYGGMESGRPLYTESASGDPFRNPDTDPFTAEEAAALEEARQNNRSELNRVKPWWDQKLMGPNDFGPQGGLQAVHAPYTSTFERQQTHGGMSNQELYDTQFSNLLGQQNDFQGQQQQAAAIREFNAAKPPTGAPVDPFGWYNEGQGLPDRTEEIAARETALAERNAAAEAADASSKINYNYTANF